MTYENQRQEYKRGKRQSKANTKERSNSLVDKWIERGKHMEKQRQEDMNKCKANTQDGGKKEEQ